MSTEVLFHIEVGDRWTDSDGNMWVVVGVGSDGRSHVLRREVIVENLALIRRWERVNA